MLHIAPDKKGSPVKRAIFTLVTLGFLTSGGYMLLLSMAPKISYFQPSEPMDVSALAEPVANQNRIIIPPINVDIPYGSDEASLNSGAWWRFPERGNPETGGNFIIAAHRFSIQATPQATVQKSPFFHLDKLKNDDPIIIDYNGKRYGYKITKQYTVAPTQTEIEAASDTPKLTLYSCTLNGANDGRVVIEATPVGQVTTKAKN